MIFANTRIKRKFTFAMLLTSGVALLLAYVAFVGVEIHASRKAMVRDLNVLADVVAINTTAALTFDNREDAQETLDALNAEPQISAAWVYDEHENLFASYSKEQTEQSPPKPIRDFFLTSSTAKTGTSQANFRPGHLFEGDRLLLARPIRINHKRIGSIYLQASLRELTQRVHLYAGISLFCLAGSLITAFALTSILRRMVVDPILGLANTARRIATEGNYSLRALKGSNDEIGLFTDDFNQMLAVIQKNTGELENQIMARIVAEEKLRSLNEGLEQRVTERTQELLRSNQELEQFAYVASHDLQEPLRVVASYMQIIEDRYKGQLDADAGEFIDFAVDGAKRMKELIEGLLAYSRVGSRGKKFEPTPCDELVKCTIANLKVAIEEQGAEITCDPLPTVEADRIQLAQLFQNLFANALKFHGEAPSKIHISATQSDGYWTFSVKDNGIGIDPNYFDRIFVIFQRLHTRVKYPGTGIGLAVCKKIVEHHGGKIWVESNPGQGTTFHFTIPQSARA